MNKETAFKELLNYVKPKVDNKKYPNIIFYFKDDKFYFEYDTKNGYFYCNYDKVWSVFETKYSMRYNEIQLFIKDMVRKHFKFKGVTPKAFDFIFLDKMKKHFKFKEVISHNSY